VAARLARGVLTIHGWFYEFQTGRIQAYDAELGDFVNLDGSRIPNATPRPRLLLSRRPGQDEPMEVVAK
jgi:carbonic anhydrase